MASPRSPEAGDPLILAVFDLDGTLTRRDTLLPYAVAFLRRHPGRLLRLPALALRLLGALVRGRGRDDLKELVIAGIFAGASRAEIEAHTARFVARLLQSGLRPEAVARLGAHRAAGHRMMIVSASTDLYVPAIARALGCDGVHCTALAWNGDAVGSRFLTPNLRGERKLHLLRELRQGWSGRMVAYGNSSSDLDHLSIVDEGFVVSPGKRLRRRASELGLTVVDW